MARRTLIVCVLVAGCSPTTDRPCVNGHAGRFECEAIDLLSFVSAPKLDAETANEVWGWTDPVDGREIVLLGLDIGTAFVDVSEPTDPVVLGTLPAASVPSHWRDIKTYADHAFIVSEAEGHGLQVLDLRTLPDEPIGTLTASYEGGDWTAHNISIDQDSGIAYLSGASSCEEGLGVVDVQDPLDPSWDGCLDFAAYVHDAQCLTWDAGDPDYLGRQLCFAASPTVGGLLIVDVTERLWPLVVSETTYPEHAFAHQAWLTEDRGWVLFNDEADEHGNNGTRTHVFDVHDIDAVTYVGFWAHDGTTVDHNLFVHDGLVYEANYNAGLRVLRPLDLSVPELEEVAYFDTAPTRDGNLTQGAWGSYPFFASGVVPVSTYVGPFGVAGRHQNREGLFLLRLHEGL